MSHRRNLTDRTFEVGLAEKISRTGEHLTTDNPFVCKVITVDHDIVQRRRLAFDNSHLHIDRVTLDVKLDGLEIEEKVSVVTVQLRNVVFTLLSTSEETFFHRNNVVNIAFGDLEDLIERFSSIYRVTGPCDIPEEVLPTLIDLKIDLQTARLDIIHGIPDNSCIPVSCLVEGTDHGSLVVLVLILVEFLRAEETDETRILGLLH